MKLIDHLKIKVKLLVLLFILLIPLTYFVASRIFQEINEYENLTEENLRLEESRKISEVIHQFQQESAAMIAAALGDSSFSVNAEINRNATNMAENNLRQFVEENNLPFSDLALLDDFQRFRDRAEQKNLNIPDFQSYRSNLIYSFINRINQDASSLSSIETSDELQSFKSLVEAKTQLGKIRSLFLMAMADRKFNYKTYAAFSAEKDIYYRAIDEFQRFASAETVQEFEDAPTSKSYEKLTSLFQQLTNNPEANLATYNPDTLFNVFTNSIDNFKVTEDRIMNRIQANVEKAQSQKETSLIFLTSAILITLLLATILSLYIITSISTALRSLKVAADRVKLGATDVKIEVVGKDEIGEVADSFRGVIQKNLALTKVAQAIGEGRYDVEVEVQSDDDILSYAIKDMKDNLNKLTQANEKRTWILTGMSELNSLAGNETTVKEMAEKVLHFLCNYSNSEVGIMYLNDETGNLSPAAAYGAKDDIDELPAFKIGTGKVGQAVNDQKVTILEDVEIDNLKVKTGLAEINPATIIILPLVFSSEIVGAIELCSRQKVNDARQEFFKTIAERISILLFTLKSNLQTQNLLYETQSQAEELETQQEELRQMNAELKASEEELKVSQEELQEKNSELEEKAQQLEEQFEALGAKNKALEDARQAIEMKIQQVETVSRYKSEFLANMSHELRTPLNSILILSRLLADDPAHNLAEKQKEHAQIIHKSGSDLLKLINEILDLSKIESGMIKLEVQEFKLGEMKMEATFDQVAHNRNIDFKVNKDASLSTITTDKFRLEQILKNLLSNAMKFTEKGGKVELSIFPVIDAHEKPKSLQDHSHLIAFAVKDNGIGIPKDKQFSIFEAFQQADTSTTRKYGGTGLGLTICKELATLLGGDITLESEEGKGSTFTLFLPQKTDQEFTDEKEIKTEKIERHVEPVVSPKPAQPQKIESVSFALDNLADGNKKKKDISILVIEDDKVFNSILAEYAKSKNFKVFQAHTGNEGFDLAKKIKPDAIMLDINLPDTTGWEVLQKIREDKDLRHVSVHIMSAYDKEVVDNFHDKEDYLPKPVTLEMLNTAFTTIASDSDKSIDTIMIVEDNEVENKAIAELLFSNSIKSVSAYSAEEAEEILAKKKIDCIILDLNLPGVKGNEWMEKIKNKKALSDIPIIIYSGKDLSEDEEIRLKKFANTIIIKNEYSYLRLLDEVQLFLHKMNQKFPMGEEFKMKLHIPEEILKDKKVLIVDDDIRNVYSLSSLLELHGLNIVAAYNGKEALQKIQQEEGFEMILMDIMMPEMDGIETIKRIRQNYKFKNLPIIALTAKAMKEDKEKCIEAGASDYIPKPVDTDKLLTLMRVWLYES